MLRGGTGCMFLSCRVFCKGPESGGGGRWVGLGLNCLLVGARLSSAASAGSRGAPGGCGSLAPRARGGLPVPPGLGRGVLRLWLSGPVGNQVGKGRNLKPRRWRGPSPLDQLSRRWNRAGARRGRRPGRAQGGKALAKASAAESESARAAQAEAGWDPRASPTWNLVLLRGSRDSPVSARQERRPGLARTRSADARPKPPECPPHCLRLTTNKKG